MELVIAIRLRTPRVRTTRQLERRLQAASGASLASHLVLGYGAVFAVASLLVACAVNS